METYYWRLQIYDLDSLLRRSMQDVKPEPVLGPIKEEDETKMPTKPILLDDGECRLCFNTFDPTQVMRNGEKLLGSAGKVRLTFV